MVEGVWQLAKTQLKGASRSTEGRKYCISDKVSRGEMDIGTKYIPEMDISVRDYPMPASIPTGFCTR